MFSKILVANRGEIAMNNTSLQGNGCIDCGGVFGGG